MGILRRNFLGLSLVPFVKFDDKLSEDQLDILAEKVSDHLTKKAKNKLRKDLKKLATTTPIIIIPKETEKLKINYDHTTIMGT